MALTRIKTKVSRSMGNGLALRGAIPAMDAQMPPDYRVVRDPRGAQDAQDLRHEDASLVRDTGRGNRPEAFAPGDPVQEHIMLVRGMENGVALQAERDRAKIYAAVESRQMDPATARQKLSQPYLEIMPAGPGFPMYAMVHDPHGGTSERVPMKYLPDKLRELGVPDDQIGSFQSAAMRESTKSHAIQLAAIRLSAMGNTGETQAQLAMRLRDHVDAGGNLGELEARELARTRVGAGAPPPGAAPPKPLGALSPQAIGQQAEQQKAQLGAQMAQQQAALRAPPPSAMGAVFGGTGIEPKAPSPMQPPPPPQNPLLGKATPTGPAPAGPSGPEMGFGGMALGGGRPGAGMQPSPPSPPQQASSASSVPPQMPPQMPPQPPQFSTAPEGPLGPFASEPPPLRMPYAPQSTQPPPEPQFSEGPRYDRRRQMPWGVQ